MFFLLGLTYAEGDIPSERKSSNVVSLATPLSPFAHSRRHAYNFAYILSPSFGNGVEKSEKLVVAVDVDRGALRKGNPITFRMLTL